MTTPETLSVIEAARKMGVTLKYIYDLVQAGKLTATKQHKKWRISAKALDERIKNRE
jgi:excisionase family DNA binding protein